MVYIVDTVRSDQMPTLTALYNAERNSKYAHCTQLLCDVICSSLL